MQVRVGMVTRKKVVARRDSFVNNPLFYFVFFVFLLSPFGHPFILLLALVASLHSVNTFFYSCYLNKVMSFKNEMCRFNIYSRANFALFQAPCGTADISVLPFCWKVYLNKSLRCSRSVNFADEHLSPEVDALSEICSCSKWLELKPPTLQTQG